MLAMMNVHQTVSFPTGKNNYSSWCDVYKGNGMWVDLHHFQDLPPSQFLSDSSHFFYFIIIQTDSNVYMERQKTQNKQPIP